MEQYENDSDYINSLRGKERYEFLLSQLDDEKLKSWVIEQENLKNKLSNEDDPMLKDIMYIGGMDISYDKDDKKVGISGLVILDYKTLDIVYEDYNIIKIEEPYVPGFLAFREVKHLVKLIDNLKLNAPQFLPQVFLLNGNGILHPKELGIACHLGVLTDTTTIGCSKSFFSIDGINKEKIKEIIEEYLHKKGDSKELIGFSGRHWGYILKSSDKDEYPLIISMGNKITNQTALKIVKKMCKQRIPEPIRLAELITRRLIRARKKFGKNNNIWNWNLKDYLINEHDYLHSNLQQSFEEGKKEESFFGEEYYGGGLYFGGRGGGRGRGFGERGRFRGRGRGFEERGRFRGRGRGFGERGRFWGRGRGFFRGDRGGRGNRGRGRGFIRGGDD